MCVILIGKINRELFEQAKTSNPDGFSLYTKEQGLIKAPNSKQVSQALGSFGIWHFRIGTYGKKDATNIHPFTICGGKAYLYHNGILGNGVGDKSDTNVLAELLKNASISTARSVLRSLSGSRNKFLLVDSKDPSNYLIYGDWEFDSGILMSHKMYKPIKTYTYKSLSQYSGWED